MKTLKRTKIIVTLLSAVVFAGLSACTTDPVERNGGNLPDKDPLENTYGVLRGTRASDNGVFVNLTEGSGFETQNIYYQITRPAEGILSWTIRVDDALLADFNAQSDVQYELLPSANYEFPDGTTLEVVSNKKRTEIKRIKFIVDGLTAGDYLLPVTVAAKTEGAQAARQTVYYKVTVRKPQVGTLEFDPDIMTVLYVNTEVYQPLLCDEINLIGNGAPQKKYTLGDIVNLRTIKLDTDAAGRAILNLGVDMRWVLDHVTKYIRPMQDKGRKICLCLEGGGKGLGFCNLSDVQIADFVAQVKAVIDEYKLDGVNFFDKNAAYGKEGMPGVNTTSYPKLIKAMREALGAEKLITLADYEAPTEYFWDTDATGGIRVGEYLDYAWSGYMSEYEDVQLLDPWHMDTEFASEYTHKPIPGLTPAQYGCVAEPWYPVNSDFLINLIGMDNVLFWKLAGYKQSNILVFADQITSLQNTYEGTLSSVSSSIYGSFADDGIIDADYNEEYSYMVDAQILSKLPDGLIGYLKWTKDW